MSVNVQGALVDGRPLDQVTDTEQVLRETTTPKCDATKKKGPSILRRSAAYNASVGKSPASITVAFQ